MSPLPVKVAGFVGVGVGKRRDLSADNSQAFNVNPQSSMTDASAEKSLALYQLGQGMNSTRYIGENAITEGNHDTTTSLKTSNLSSEKVKHPPMRRVSLKYFEINEDWHKQDVNYKQMVVRILSQI